MNTVSKLLAPFPRARLAHLPTPIDELVNLNNAVGGPRLFMKRDDCTGLALGGNKARKLEYYLGEAMQQKADTLLITGAVQSNYVRMAAAAAAKLGMACHIQLEERVPDVDEIYRRSGNVLLDRILGASIHSYPEGEDEMGADRCLEGIARELRAQGKRPYIIYLSADHPPLGALGYVHAADEILTQMKQQRLPIEHIVIASGSALSHSGLLLGLRARDSEIPVTGVCVRRSAELQVERVGRCVQALGRLLNLSRPVVTAADIRAYDRTLAPGYGRLNPELIEAIGLLGRTEGILLDPVYTGKAMAGLLAMIRSRKYDHLNGVLFVHTGGIPALFAYEPALISQLNQLAAKLDPDMRERNT